MMIPFGLKHVGIVSIIIQYKYLRKNIVHFFGEDASLMGYNSVQINM
jgi:hypothetical protein